MAREYTVLHISSKFTILQIPYNFKLYLAKTVIFVNNAIYLCLYIMSTKQNTFQKFFIIFNYLTTSCVGTDYFALNMDYAGKLSLIGKSVNIIYHTAFFVQLYHSFFQNALPCFSLRKACIGLPQPHFHIKSLKY